MTFFDEVKTLIEASDSKEVFLIFDQLYVHFPNGRPDHFRPTKPVDLEKLHSESIKKGFEPFSKALYEGGVWFMKSTKKSK